MSTLQKYLHANAWPFTKPWLVGLLVFLLLSGLCAYIIKQRYDIQLHEEKETALNMAESAKSRLQQSLQYSLSATQALTLTIDKEGVSRHFDSIAAYILQSNKYVDALQLVPGGTIRYVYPLKGNEAVIGYNILEDSTRNKEAFKAIEKKELFFAGPFQLRQGEMGVVGRLPVFRNNKFWGFSAAIIHMPTLLQAAGIDTSGASGYNYQLSKINPDTKKEEFFLPVKEKSVAYTEVAVSVPDGEWKLSVVPVNGYKSFQTIIPISILSLILCIVGAVFATYLSKTPARLQKMVLEQTAELERSEKRNKAIVNALPDMVFVIDREYRYIDFHNSSGNQPIVNTALFMFKKVRDTLPEPLASDVMGYLDKVLNTGQVYSHSYDLETNGELRQYEARYVPHKKDDVLVLVRDITERKKAEADLKTSNERFNLIAIATNDTIWDWDLVSGNMWWNENFYKLFQLEKDKVKPDIHSWYDGLHPDDRERAKKSLLAAIENRDTTWTEEYRFMKSNGEAVEIYDRGYVVYDSRGKPSRMIGSMLDITERKKAELALRESENRLKTILDTDPECIKLINHDLKLIDINSSGLEMIEADNPEQVKNCSLLDLVTGKYKAMTASLVNDAFDGKSGMLEFEMQTLKGALRWCEILIVPFRNADGDITAALGVTRDMTNWKMAEEKIKRSFEEIRRLSEHLQNIREEERMHVAREIHDELGQQLTVLKMDISRLGKKTAAKDDNLTPDINEILGAINKMVETVRKISSELRPGLLDDLGLVAAIDWYCQDFSKRTGIKTSFISGIKEDDFPEKINIGIFRIFQESLTNVARHSEAKKAGISLMWQDKQLVLMIEDDGTGFDANAIQDKKTLGIMGMKERANMMGGTYNVFSTPGKGTIIEVAVPFADHELSETPQNVL